MTRASSWLGSTFFARAEESRLGRRAGEVAWLRGLAAGLPDAVRPHLVAHRGFHSTRDRTDCRPLENSLEAYELAWTSGINLCECDVAVTADGALVLCHDADYARLALAVPGDEDRRALRVGELTLSELMALPLKTGSRPPLLVEVLRSAAQIGASDARLVVEIKPGNTAASAALLALFRAHPDLARRVAVVMSFDAFIMHDMAAALAGSAARPKLLLLTVSEALEEQPELWTIFDVDGDTAGALKTAAGLDGVYCQYQPSMLTPEGAARTRALAAGRVLGVWGYADRDPDTLDVACALVVDCGATFVNTDLPQNFAAGPEPSSPASTAPNSPASPARSPAPPDDGAWGFFEADATPPKEPARSASFLGGFDALWGGRA